MSRRRKLETLYSEENGYDDVRQLRQQLQQANSTIESLSQEIEDLESRNRVLESKNQHLISALQSEYGQTESQYSDRVLNCKVCGDDFIFTVGQQADYDQRGLQNDPARCRECRDSTRGSHQSTHIVPREVEYRQDSFQDRGLECRDCGGEFVFSAAQQEDYDRRGLQNDPSRCQDCRTAKREGYTREPRQDGFRDRVLGCKDCRSMFVFSAGQQKDYERRGLLNDPGRCQECRRPGAVRGKPLQSHSSVSFSQSKGDGDSLHDRVLNCKECGGKFVFTVSQQEGHKRRGLKHDPVRCKDCRSVLKGEKSHGGLYIDHGVLTANSALMTSR